MPSTRLPWRFASVGVGPMVGQATLAKANPPCLPPHRACPLRRWWRRGWAAARAPGARSGPFALRLPPRPRRCAQRRRLLGLSTARAPRRLPPRGPRAPRGPATKVADPAPPPRTTNLPPNSPTRPPTSATSCAPPLWRRPPSFSQPSPSPVGARPGLDPGADQQPSRRTRAAAVMQNRTSHCATHPRRPSPASAAAPVAARRPPNPPPPPPHTPPKRLCAVPPDGAAL